MRLSAGWITLCEAAGELNRTQSEPGVLGSRSTLVCASAMEGTLCVAMIPLLALSHRSGMTVAEVGFLLIVIAGVWLVAAEIPALGISKARKIVAGIAFAAAGVLLIIATHWGHFG